MLNDDKILFDFCQISAFPKRLHSEAKLLHIVIVSERRVRSYLCIREGEGGG